MAGEEGELRGSIGRLDSTIGDLKIAVAELRVTVSGMAARDVEDRTAIQRAAEHHEERISRLERWRSRVNGQLALLGILAGGSAVYAIGHLLQDGHVHP